MRIIIMHKIVKKTKDIKLKQNKFYKEKIVWIAVIIRYSYISLVINSTNFKGKPIMYTLGDFCLFVFKKHFFTSECCHIGNSVTKPGKSSIAFIKSVSLYSEQIFFCQIIDRYWKNTDKKKCNNIGVYF